MFSVRFQGKPFNITVIQVYDPTSNTEEADIDWFDLLAAQGTLKSLLTVQEHHFWFSAFFM